MVLIRNSTRIVIKRVRMLRFVLVGLFLVQAVSGEESRCEDTCIFNYDGDCDDGSPGSDYSYCACGTDCYDCGTQLCATDDDGGSFVDDNFFDDSDCRSGYRTCRKDGYVWCCDRSSRTDRCGDSVGVCKSNTSKKTKKTITGVLIAVIVVIVLAIVGGILACCFCCTGCPGYTCVHGDPNKPAAQAHTAVPTAAPGVVVVHRQVQEPTIVQGVVVKESAPSAPPATPENA